MMAMVGEATMRTVSDEGVALKDDVAGLKGDNYERKAAEHVASVLARAGGGLRRIRLVAKGTLADRLDNAIDAGLITEHERAEALAADLVAEARRHPGGEQVVLVGEASVTLGRGDVERAGRRAAIVGRALGLPGVAVVVTTRVPKGLDVGGVEAVVYQSNPAA